jgi:uncharacterized protein YycO
MNTPKTVLMLVAAIIITAGTLVTALNIAAQTTQAKLVCAGEKDTRSCPTLRKCVIRLEEGKKVTECTG